ncbi:MAG: glycosyltransferase family 9 protein, partial [Flavobacteriales bacterium]
NLGVKIGKPVFEPHYMPVIDDKYITIHVDNKIDSKYYEYFPEALELLKNILTPRGYKIYQIGGGDDPTIKEADKSYLGFSRKQTAYIMRGSSLHLGIDSFPIHLASVYDVPIVALYSHIYPQHARPYWSSSNKVKILEADRNGNKPSYNYQERPKTIHTIKPEEIVQSVCELLNIQWTKSIETQFIGDDYCTRCVEIIPNFFGESNELKNYTLNIRMDYFFNEDSLIQWCSQYKVGIVSDQPIHPEILNRYRNNIKQITFLINDTQTFSLKYLETVKNLGIDMVGECGNKERLSEIKEYYFDFLIEPEKDLDNETINKIRQKKNLRFLTKKDIFASGKRYYSKAHFDADIEAKEKWGDTIDNLSFWRDLDYYYIYESF